MPVAQDNGIKMTKVQAQLFRVGQQQIALAGVKEQVALADLKMKRQSVFGHQSGALDAVLDEHRDTNVFTHAELKICQWRLPLPRRPA